MRRNNHAGAVTALDTPASHALELGFVQHGAVVAWESCTDCGDRAPVFSDGHRLLVVDNDAVPGPRCTSCYRKHRRREIVSDPLDPRSGPVIVATHRPRPRARRRRRPRARDPRPHRRHRPPLPRAHVTAWPDGGLSVALEAPDAGGAIDLRKCRRIAEHLAIYDGASTTSIGTGYGVGDRRPRRERRRTTPAPVPQQTRCCSHCGRPFTRRSATRAAARPVVASVLGHLRKKG